MRRILGGVTASQPTRCSPCSGLLNIARLQHGGHEPTTPSSSPIAPSEAKKGQVEDAAASSSVFASVNSSSSGESGGVAQVAAAVKQPPKGLFERRMPSEMSFHIPVRRPRGDLPPDAVDPVSGLPILHPKAMNLPVPPPTPDLIGFPEKWSFRLDTTRAEHQVNLYEVPNSDPPVLLPMQMSSLTVPSMSKRRFALSTWSSMEDQGPIPDHRTDAFLKWLKRCSSTHGEHSALYHAQLDENISLCLGHRMVRGVYAKRHFSPGDVILDIPIDQDPMNVASYGSVINTERMKLCSRVANHEHVKMPSFDAVYSTINVKRSELDMDFHALFVDQIMMALYLACEKAVGEASPLHPYLSLFPHPFLDDEGIVMEANKEVGGTRAYLNYKEHVKQMCYLHHQIKNAWPAGGCPPSLDMFMWALRLVLSRQQMLEKTRLHCDEMIIYAEDNVSISCGAEPDLLTRGIRAVHRFLLHNVLRVLDTKREHVNEFHPRTAPCVVPLLDMIGHDPAGISPNIAISVERGGAEADKTDQEIDLKMNKLGQLGTSIIVRATEEIFPNQPLQRIFPRCFSLGYTLFRYGFLPLRHRDVDRRESAKEFDVMHLLPQPGVPDMFGTDGSVLPDRFLEKRYDGTPAHLLASEEKSKTSIPASR